MRKHIIDSFNNSDFEPKRLLQVNSCGSEHITNHEYTVFRPNGRKDYHFLYVKSGWIDAEEAPELVEQFGIRQAPTLVVVKNGEANIYANASNIIGYISEN